MSWRYCVICKGCRVLITIKDYNIENIEGLEFSKTFVPFKFDCPRCGHKIIAGKKTIGFIKVD